MSRDRAFLWVLGASFAFLLAFGVGATILSLTGNPSDQVSLRAIGAIGSMFSSIIGLILGYMVGRNNGGKNGPTRPDQ